MSSFLKKTFICIIAAFCLLTLCSCSKSPDKISPEIAEFQARSEKFILDNGLVLLVKQTSDIPLVSIQACLLSGSSTEGEYTGSGISHLMEHMMFKGTQKRSVGQIEQDIKALGGQIGAYTSFDYSLYKINVPSEYSSQALEILSDAIFNSVFDANELEKEKEVILSEMKLTEDDPSRKLGKSIWKNAYKVHPYSMPIIGQENIFRNLTREDLIKYHGQRYIPNNMILSIAGDVDLEKIHQAVEDTFGAYQPKPFSPLVLPEEPAQLGSAEGIEYYNTRPAQLMIAFHSTSIFQENTYPLDLLASLLSDSEGSRLDRVLRKEKKLVYSINSFNYTPKYPGLFLIHAVLEPENYQKAKEEIMRVIDQIKEVTPDKNELQRFKKVIRAQYILSLQTSDALASDMASSYALTNDPDFTFKYLENIDKVTPRSVSMAARKYLDRDNMTICAIFPAEAKEEAQIKPSLEFKPTEPDKFELPNGLRVLIRENHSLPLVTIRATFLGGLRAEDEKDAGIFNFVSAVLFKGTKKKRAEEISKLLDRLGAGVFIQSGNNSLSCGVTLMGGDFAAGLDLLKEIVTQSVFPKNEVELARSAILASIASQNEDIFYKTSLLMKSSLFTEHPFRHPQLGTEDSIKVISRSDLYKTYRKYCIPNNMVLSVSGDINKDYALKQIKRAFGRWHKKRMPEINPQEEPLLAQPKTIENKMDKEQTLILLGYLGLRVTDKDRYTMDVLSSILNTGQHSLYYKVRDIIGASYTLGFFPVLGIERGYNVLYVSTTEEKKEQVKEELFRIIDSFKTQDIDEQELESAKKELLASHYRALETNEGFSGSIALDEIYGLGYLNYLDYADKINKITKEDLKELANKYFTPESYVLVTTSPEEK